MERLVAPLAAATGLAGAPRSQNIGAILCDWLSHTLPPVIVSVRRRAALLAAASSLAGMPNLFDH